MNDLAIKDKTVPSKKEEKRVKILLEENDDIPPTGQYFGCNGESYMLMPGRPVEVPQGIVDILDNAVTTTPVKDPRTLQVIGYRDRLRYPYRRIS